MGIFPVVSQESSDSLYYSLNDRQWLVDLPLWAPGFRGQMAYGNIDFSSSNTEKREYDRVNGESGLEFYFVGRIALDYKKIWIQFGVFSGKVSSAFSFIRPDGSEEKEFVSISANSSLPSLVAGYSVYSSSYEKTDFKWELIPFLGARYITINISSDILEDTPIIDVRSSWIEGLIGLYIPIQYKRFQLGIQNDFGFTKSKSTWAFSGRMRYRISRLVDVHLGWTYLIINHEDIIDSIPLNLDITLSGPSAGVGFRF